MASTKKTRIIFSLLLLSWFCAWPVCGYTMTTSETNRSITIPITQWTGLKNELAGLNNDLIQCQSDLKQLKKPSSQLVEELTQAQDLLKKLNQDLEQQKQDLTLLSNEAAESKTLLQKLREQINKERNVHKRQIWQNRIWCFVGGAVIGVIATK